ncbi:MAG: OsmC family peroxiredoxin [Gemmatimonadota bacterium]|jgi:osmotically inducible protein OsmC
MPVRTARAEWNGNLKEGTGSVRTESGAVDGPYNFPSRFEEGDQTNPEELVGAAHAACFAMALSNILASHGHDPRSVRATAKVRLEVKEGGAAITGIQLVCRATVGDIEEDHFLEHAEEAKKGCPVSKALAAVPIELDAALEG